MIATVNILVPVGCKKTIRPAARIPEIPLLVRKHGAVIAWGKVQEKSRQLFHIAKHVNKPAVAVKAGMFALVEAPVATDP